MNFGENSIPHNSKIDFFFQITGETKSIEMFSRKQKKKINYGNSNKLSVKQIRVLFSVLAAK